MRILRHLLPAMALVISGALLAEDNETENSSAQEEVQEVKYVTDKLRLSLYKNADGSSGTIKLLVSGDELQILQRQGNYAKVRTSQGLTGWVKNGFLVSEPTATIQLVEEKKKNDILAAQIEKYADTRKLVDDYEKTIELMTNDNQKNVSELESLKAELEKNKAEVEELDQQLQQSLQGKMGIQDVIQIIIQYWYVLLITGLLLLLVGFLTGKLLVESQVKSRFQGVKVW